MSATNVDKSTAISSSISLPIGSTAIQTAAAAGPDGTPPAAAGTRPTSPGSDDDDQTPEMRTPFVNGGGTAAARAGVTASGAGAGSWRTDDELWLTRRATQPQQQQQQQPAFNSQSLNSVARVSSLRGSAALKLRKHSYEGGEPRGSITTSTSDEVRRRREMSVTFVSCPTTSADDNDTKKTPAAAAAAAADDNSSAEAEMSSPDVATAVTNNSPPSLAERVRLILCRRDDVQFPLQPTVQLPQPSDCNGRRGGSDQPAWSPTTRHLLPTDFKQHSLFVQLDVLCHFEDDSVGWKEMARWLKYEEKVETGGRWSKPHVSTASLHSLFEVRRAVERNSCVVDLQLDVDVDQPGQTSLDHLAVAVTSIVDHDTDLNAASIAGLRHILLRPHKHKDRRGRRAPPPWVAAGGGRPPESTAATGTVKNGDIEAATPGAAVANEMTSRSVSPQGTLTSQQQQQQQQQVPPVRRKSLVKREGKEFWEAHTTYRYGVTPDNLKPYTPNKRLMHKIPGDAESVSLLVGQVDFLDGPDPLLTLLRFSSAAVVDGLCEVAVPTRFLFLAVGSSRRSSIVELSELGRAMATLFNDKVFCEVAYRATSVGDLLTGIDEFLDELIVLPPSIWDPTIRLEPPEKTRSSEKIWKRISDVSRHEPCPDTVAEPGADDVTLRRTGRIFGGLISDIRLRYRYFVSDFTDGFNMQCVASIVFLYFACITPIVTFGGMLGQETDGCMGTMETLISGAVCGIGYSLFAGQPLNIVGATGPLLVFESILYRMCTENFIDFLAFRFWIGVWIAFNLFVVVAFDLSAFVRYITRFTEESFAVLISVIFIYESVSKVADIWTSHPVRRRTRYGGGMSSSAGNSSSSSSVHDGGPMCYCELPRDSPAISQTYSGGDVTGLTSSYPGGPSTAAAEDLYNASSAAPFSFSNWTSFLPEHCVTYLGRLVIRRDCLDEVTCVRHGWTPVGTACYVDSITRAVPDVFLLSCVLFFGTFAVAYFLRTFRTTRYFPTQVRTVLGDFAVFLAIVLWTGVDALFGLDTPKLNVPPDVKPTKPNRGWIITPLPLTQWWLILLAILPGILGTILVFLDQQITSVIVNRKEHKLKKGHGYHLDLFVLAILIIVCSLMGLPWFVAATVRAITHVRSLMTESEVKAPGDRPQMLGVREQRLTGICIHLLIGCSTFLTFVLQHIPMPVLYGVFLYMGITSLRGIQFIERILIMFMPIKYQPDYIYLRHVQTSRVHYFTLIQVACSALMWAVKSVRSTSIAFPLMLIGLMAARKTMDFLFAQRDLYWLDHLLPDESRRKREDLEKVLNNQRDNCIKDEQLDDEGPTSFSCPSVSGNEKTSVDYSKGGRGDGAEALQLIVCRTDENSTSARLRTSLEAVT